jgi:outer membrane autotransporter protein
VRRQRQCRTLIASAAALVLLAAADAGHAEQPESVALPLSYKGSDAFPNLISLSVGGGNQTNITFDSGSTGLYILESEVGSDVTLTSTPFKQRYEDGTEFEGHVGLAKVTFKTATGEVTTSEIRLGVIEHYTCGSDPDCLADRSGVMGTRYYQYKLSEGETGVPTGIFNPLAFLPDNLGSGYMVAATGPTPSIIVGLTPNNTQDFPSTAIMPMDVNTPIPQYAPLAWELKSIDACFQIETDTAECAVTSFDTGESGAQFTASGHSAGELAPGTLVTVSIPSVGITRTFIAGDTNWVDKFNVIASQEGIPLGFNSGGQFYNYYAIAYDYFQGLAYFSPITTWITGTYAPANDSDLGPPGVAIALAGTLSLPEGFSSSRPIFLGNNSTIRAFGAAKLSGTLSGGAVLTLDGPGQLTLLGTSLNTGLITVNGSRLFVDGSTPAPVQLNNGMLGGNGSIGALNAMSGGYVAPGHSIGTLTVAGDATFAAGSTYAAEIGRSGKSDRIDAGGSAVITGGRLLVLPDATYRPGFDRFTVLTAMNGVSGAFDLSAPDFGTAGAAFPFLNVSATNTVNSVVVSVGRSDVSFAAAGQTANQRASAFGADQLPLSSALVEALAGLNLMTAAAALDAISGEIYASAQTVLIENATYMRSALLGRLREVSGTAAPVTAWGQAYGGFGQNEANFNAGGVDRSGGGFLTGVDARLRQGRRVGLAAGGGHSNFDLAARRSSGSADDFTLAAYGGGPFSAGGPGQAALFFGGAYTWQQLDAKRSVAFPGFFDSVEADYNAGTFQLFGEAAYRMALGPTRLGDARVEPFAGLAYTDVQTEDFRERGGAAALRGSDDSFSSTTSALGLRAASTFSLQNGRRLEVHGTAAWQHAFGDRVPGAALAFSGQAQPFTVFGAPLATDSLVLEAGFDAVLSEGAHLGAAYIGQIADSAHGSAFKGQLSLRF